MKPLNQRVYRYYIDSGHGWLAVKRQYLDRLKLLNKISDCSYERGGTVYLEEDCDAPLFVDAYKLLYLKSPNIVTVYVDNRSPIRSYKSYANITNTTERQPQDAES